MKETNINTMSGEQLCDLFEYIDEGEQEPNELDVQRPGDFGPRVLFVESNAGSMFWTMDGEPKGVASLFEAYA